MNPRRYIFTLLCILLCTSVHGKKLRKFDTTDFTNTRLRYFFIEPVALIDVYNHPSLRIGAEYGFSKRYSANVTYGTYGSLSDYCIKLEMKRYFAFDEKIRYYASLQYFYKHTYSSVNDESRTIPKGQPGYDIDYNVSKYATFINANAGIVSFHRRHVIIDGYAGIGMRYHSVLLQNLSYTQAADRYHNHESVIDDFTNNNHKGWRLNLSLGMRFGFGFRY